MAIENPPFIDACPLTKPWKLRFSIEVLFDYQRVGCSESTWSRKGFVISHNWPVNCIYSHHSCFFTTRFYGQNHGKIMAKSTDLRCFCSHFRALSCSFKVVKMKQAAMAAAAEFTWSNAALQYEQVFTELGVKDVLNGAVAAWGWVMGWEWFFSPDLLGGLSRLSLKKWGILGKNGNVFAPDLVSTLVIKHPEVNGGCDRQSSNIIELGKCPLPCFPDMGLSENRVYSQWNSHLIGIMIMKTIGCRGLAYFQTNPYFQKVLQRSLVDVLVGPWWATMGHMMGHMMGCQMHPKLAPNRWFLFGRNGARPLFGDDFYEFNSCFFFVVPLGLVLRHYVTHSPYEFALPSGKRLHNCRKSPFLMGKSTINGNFQ